MAIVRVFVTQRLLCAQFEKFGELFSSLQYSSSTDKKLVSSSVLTFTPPQSPSKMDHSGSVPGTELPESHSKQEDVGGHANAPDVARQQISQEIPFLVTHWLANYEKSKSNASGDEEEKAAMAKIRHAASEIASAFATLGAYGTTLRVCCSVVYCLFLLTFPVRFLWLTHIFCILFECTVFLGIVFLCFIVLLIFEPTGTSKPNI